jgi:hypothetical protein
MSRQQDLQDMHDLLQQMKDVHEMELLAPDHCEWGPQSLWNHVKNSASNYIHGKVSDETVLTTYFERKEDDAQKLFLTTLAGTAAKKLDVYRALKALITASMKTKTGQKYMIVDENSFNHNETQHTLLKSMMDEIISTTEKKIIFQKLITYVDLRAEIMTTYKSEIEPVKTELQTAKDAKKSSNTTAQP